MADMWQKIVEVMRKTGDRCLIADPTSEEVFVLMDLASYEAFLDSKFGNLTQKTEKAIIDPDFTPPPLNPEPDPEPDWEAMQEESFAEPSGELESKDDRFYLEPIE